MTTQNLQEAFKTIKTQTLLDLFQDNPQRIEALSLTVGQLFFDFSKNHITSHTLKSLCEFAQSKDMQAAINSLLGGDEVNNTEKRPALHSALREPPADKGHANQPTSNQVQQALSKMDTFVEALHQQEWKGFSGKAIDTVVNIGIGGSDLGPRMVTQALADYHVPQISVHFVANIDGADLQDTLKKLNPESTLFIVASKSFTTLETLNNALSAREWVLESGCDQGSLHKHFVAISSNIQAASEFGIAEENIFPMWDWVGGRYSLWSAIGLPIALATGMNNFRSLLTGAHEMDQHFKQTPLEKNIPVIAALISHWYSHYWGTTSHAVLPYSQRLSRLPAYLQQLDMESLGKQVSKEGTPLNYPSGLVIWGTEGTNGQHSFHQLLHQGTQLIPVDFIAVKESMSRYTEQHQHLLACCISQSQALLQGKTLQQATTELREQGLSEQEVLSLAPHKVVPGNRPSTFILMESLTPQNLGALIAFYEHKVYASSVLLGINAFDQWGVELGKQLGKPLYGALTEGVVNAEWDSSTKSIVNKLRG
jgi:glucose-6-phosphate isomerase